MKKGCTHSAETIRKMRESQLQRCQIRKQVRTEARIAARTARQDNTVEELKLEKMRQCEICFTTGVLSGEIQGNWSVFNVDRHDVVPRVVLPVINFKRFAFIHFDLNTTEAGDCLDRALVFLEEVGRVSLDKKAA